MPGLFLLVTAMLLYQPAFAISDIQDQTKFTSLSQPVKITDTEVTEFFIKYKGMVRIVMIICLIVSITSLAISLARLSASGSNDQARVKALKGVLYSVVSLALFGGTTIIMGFAFGLFS